MTSSKICTGCEVAKDVSEFYKRKQSKDGLCFKCKTCVLNAQAALKLRDKVAVERKQCNVCKETKDISDFHKKTASTDGYNGLCKVCAIARAKVQAKKHEARVKAYRDVYEKTKRKQSRAAYVAANTETIRAKARNYLAKRLATDASYRTRVRLRARFQKAKKKIVGESKRTMQYVGCSVPQVREWLSSQFDQGMSWNNFGEWQIDHVLPVSLFDLAQKDACRVCFHWTNLQPLWKKDNLKKSNKLCLSNYFRVQAQVQGFLAVHQDLAMSGYETMCTSTRWLRSFLSNVKIPGMIM